MAAHITCHKNCKRLSLSFIHFSAELGIEAIPEVDRLPIKYAGNGCTPQTIATGLRAYERYSPSEFVRDNGMASLVNRGIPLWASHAVSTPR